jgi:hypothetical protein
MEFGVLPELSLSLVGYAPELSARARIQLATDIGYRSVTLDAKTPGLRPRELDRSAKRDIASLFRRNELRLSGIDLWIPPEHFVQPEHIDRAVGAVTACIDLVQELVALTPGDAVVSVQLPREGAVEAERAIAASAERAGALISDCRWPMRGFEGSLGAGLDPVAALAAGQDPVLAASGSSILSARVSSMSDVALRVALDDPSSRLDLDAYRASLSLAPMLRTLVVDVRGVLDAQAAGEAALQEWAQSGL